MIKNNAVLNTETEQMMQCSHLMSPSVAIALDTSASSWDC